MGATLHPDVRPDWAQDTIGDNISNRNAKYSELTGLYWLWKNDDSDFQGIVHYRRHSGSASRAVGSFKGLSLCDRFQSIIGESGLTDILHGFDIVLPRKRNYFIETIYSHCTHTFPGEQLDTTRAVIAECTSGHLPAFNAVMAGKTAHTFNMFVMRRRKLGEYCLWLFSILEELEHRINDSAYDALHDQPFVGLSNSVQPSRADQPAASGLPPAHAQTGRFPAAQTRVAPLLDDTGTRAQTAANRSAALSGMSTPAPGDADNVFAEIFGDENQRR